MAVHGPTELAAKMPSPLQVARLRRRRTCRGSGGGMPGKIVRKPAVVKIGHGPPRATISRPGPAGERVCSSRLWYQCHPLGFSIALRERDSGVVFI